LKLHITPQALLIGGLSGIVTALLCIWWTLRSLRDASPRSLLAGLIENVRGVGAVVRRSGFSRLFRRRALPPEGGTTNMSFRSAIVFGAIGIALLAAAVSKQIGQVGGFFGAGTLLLIAILCFWSAWLRSDKKQTIQGQGAWPMARMGFRNATTRPGRSV